MQKGSVNGVAVVRLRFFSYTAVGSSHCLYPLTVSTVRQSALQHYKFTTSCLESSASFIVLLLLGVSPYVNSRCIIYVFQLRVQSMFPFVRVCHCMKCKWLRIIYVSCCLMFPVTRLLCCLHLSPSVRLPAKQVRKGKSYGTIQVVPLPSRSAGLPRAWPLSIPIVPAPTSELPNPGQEVKDTAPILPACQDSPGMAFQLSHRDVSTASSLEALSRSVTLWKCEIQHNHSWKVQSWQYNDFIKTFKGPMRNIFRDLLT